MVALPTATEDTVSGNDGKLDNALKNPIVERLMVETGISEAHARELIIMVGGNWSSLVREARLIRTEFALPVTRLI